MIRRLFRSLRWILPAIALAVLVGPWLQCLVLRFRDPPFTWTMVGRAWDSLRETGDFAWPRRSWVDMEEISCDVPRAAVASEDTLFFEHHGFDFKAMRQALEESRRGGRMRGASTISQQVARNAFLWLGRSWVRKGLEAWYTVALEVLVPKERILEVYLNIAETGRMRFGIEAAAQETYGRPAAKLNAEQAATLISTLPSPRKWRPGSKVVQERTAWILAHPVALPKDLDCVR
jgi:monofunctional biosynthetic peptidoglycan transglycosylase